VQPVFVDDMVAAFVAAIERPEADGEPIAVAGPEPITYRAFAGACAEALGRRIVVVPIPSWLMAAASRLATMIGVRLPIGTEEFARAGESKAFDVGPMRRRLGVDPRPFAEGLRLKIARGWYPGGAARPSAAPG